MAGKPRQQAMLSDGYAALGVMAFIGAIVCLVLLSLVQQAGYLGILAVVLAVAGFAGLALGNRSSDFQERK